MFLSYFEDSAITTSFRMSLDKSLKVCHLKPPPENLFRIASALTHTVTSYHVEAVTQLQLPGVWIGALQWFWHDVV